MISELYRAPTECPVYGEDLIVIRKGCTYCDPELAGEFASSPYDRLDVAEHEPLRVSLTSRGNPCEMEKHLQVSYSTARARFDVLLMKLGMDPDVQPTPPQPGESGPTEQGETKATTPQEQISARVVTGEISAEVAAQLIAGLN